MRQAAHFAEPTSTPSVGRSPSRCINGCPAGYPVDGGLRGSDGTSAPGRRAPDKQPLLDSAAAVHSDSRRSCSARGSRGARGRRRGGSAPRPTSRAGPAVGPWVRSLVFHGLGILASDVVDADERSRARSRQPPYGRRTYWLRKARAAGVSTRCSQGPLSHSEPARLHSTAVMPRTRFVPERMLGDPESPKQMSALPAE
jgi:hypothetical protein